MNICHAAEGGMEENKVGMGDSFLKGMTGDGPTEKVSCGQRPGSVKSIPGRGNR